MEISFVNDEFSDNIDEALAFAKKNGLKYIELRQISGKNVTELSKEEAFSLANKIASAGILVSAIASPFLKWKQNETDFNIFGQPVASETDYFISLMDLADIFGAPNIRIYSYLKQDDLTIDELGIKLDAYSQLALDRGIGLLLENDGLCNIDTIHKMHQLFATYSFSNIFPLLDLGTMLALADDFIPHELQDLIGMCLYFHIKDYDADLKRFVAVGDGNVDYENLLAEKLLENEAFFSLDTHTGYPEDLQMSLNILETWED